MSEEDLFGEDNDLVRQILDQYDRDEAWFVVETVEPIRKANHGTRMSGTISDRNGDEIADKQGQRRPRGLIVPPSPKTYSPRLSDSPGEVEDLTGDNRDHHSFHAMV